MTPGMNVGPTCAVEHMICQNHRTPLYLASQLRGKPKFLPCWLGIWRLQSPLPIFGHFGRELDTDVFPVPLRQSIDLR